MRIYTIRNTSFKCTWPAQNLLLYKKPFDIFVIRALLLKMFCKPLLSYGMPEYSFTFLFMSGTNFGCRLGRQDNTCRSVSQRGLQELKPSDLVMSQHWRWIHTASQTLKSCQ